MTPVQAWVEGARRVAQAPALLLLLWLVTLLTTLPLGLGVYEDIRRQLGSSLVTSRPVPGATYDWLTEFGEQQHASGSATLGPQVIGFAAVVDNASAVLDATRRPMAIGSTVAVYAFCWTFLAGGLIDRLARGRPTSAEDFFRCCGSHASRLLRLSVISAVIYALLMTRAHSWLFAGQYERLTEGLDTERTAFAIRVGLYALLILGLAAVNLWFDYAKIRLVVERRFSVIGALRSAARLLRRRTAAAAALYLLDVALLAISIGAYAVAAPGAGSTWLAFFAGQAYVAARLAVKLAFWASEAVWFQDQSRYTHLSVRPTTEAP